MFHKLIWYAFSVRVWKSKKERNGRVFLFGFSSISSSSGKWIFLFVSKQHQTNEIYRCEQIFQLYLLTINQTLVNIIFMSHMWSSVCPSRKSLHLLEVRLRYIAVRCIILCFYIFILIYAEHNAVWFILIACVFNKICHLCFICILLVVSFLLKMINCLFFLSFGRVGFWPNHFL